ncbi:MAG TPA: DUF58 domain-containing protein, partial [Polyangiales bacterium]|nr:DUF58 domain-containing protein [Polyangiales bacterium]
MRELCPLTLRGFALVALSLLGLRYYGFQALDAVWYVTGLGLLALTLVMTLAVLAGALRLKLALRKQDVHAVAVGCETQREVPTGFALPSLRIWLFLDVRIVLREPLQASAREQREGGRIHEQVRFGDHGEVRRIARTLIVADVFGLASLGLRREDGADVDVLPHAGALRSLPLLRSLSGGDDVPHPMGLEQGDRLELRRYAPGDPARFIHWKVFARTQKLVVRMPERALSRAERVAAYLVAGPADAASAAAARVALEEGAFGSDFRFGADGSPRPHRELTASLVALRRSSAVREDSGEGLSAFLRELDREGPSSLVLFVPAAEGPWVERLGGVLSKQKRNARVVIGVDGITQEQTTWLARVALLPASSARVPLSTLRSLIAAYRRH